MDTHTEKLNKCLYYQIFYQWCGWSIYPEKELNLLSISVKNKKKKKLKKLSLKENRDESQPAEFQSDEEKHLRLKFVHKNLQELKFPTIKTKKINVYGLNWAVLKIRLKIYTQYCEIKSVSVSLNSYCALFMFPSQLKWTKSFLLYLVGIF